MSIMTKLTVQLKTRALLLRWDSAGMQLFSSQPAVSLDLKLAHFSAGTWHSTICHRN